LEPTSLERGGARFRAVTRGWRRIGVATVKVSGGGMGGRRTNLNHDAVDGIFKLRSSSKIAFDIGVRSFDKKIKICIIL
jgi:hypothetical protein